MEQVLGLQDFQAFAFTKAGSPWVQIGHGLGKFFSFTNTVPEVHGKVLMFVGDCGPTHDPPVVLPPVQNTWKWGKVNVAHDVEACKAHGDANMEGGLWEPVGGGHAFKDIQVPYILALPWVLVMFIMQKGGQC